MQTTSGLRTAPLATHTTQIPGRPHVCHAATARTLRSCPSRCPRAAPADLWTCAKLTASSCSPRSPGPVVFPGDHLLQSRKLNISTQPRKSLSKREHHAPGFHVGIFFVKELALMHLLEVSWVCASSVQTGRSLHKLMV